LNGSERLTIVGFYLGQNAASFEEALGAGMSVFVYE